ncbi:MAG: hypothetical protein ACRD3W_07670 [Terriglobales bacterium]
MIVLNKKSVLCVLVGGLIGFLVGGGWEIFLNFEQWQSATFYRSHDDNLILFTVWFWFGPARSMAAGMAIGAAFYFLQRRRSQAKQS